MSSRLLSSSRLTLSFFASVLLAQGALRAENETDQLLCRKSSAFLAPVDSPHHRKYARSREVDITHLALDVTPDFVKRQVAVTTRLTLRPIALPLAELKLDAVKLSIDEVSSTEPVQAWRNTDQQLVITFRQPVPADRELTLTIRSRAEPKAGLYFRTPEQGYKDGDTHLFTQGEAIEARQWYPCYDEPNEKFTSEITCRVPEGMTVLANGRRVSSEKDPATGLVAVRWSQEQPHSNYLISLLAGYFRTLEDKVGELPIAFHTPPSEFDTAASSFRDTKEAISFFEKEIGVKYPWAKYDQVCVNDFVAGGMENTSITTLTDGTLFADGFETLRSSQELMAHELAHQWFGDLVTCKDWTHLWLNEGAATYYAHLFDGHMNGRDSMLYGLLQDARSFLDAANDTRPIADRTFDDPNQQFGYHAYQKGSWVLHMLRSQLGEELYRKCIQTYLERHRFGNVVTEDLNRVLEELSGRSWDQFFDQWVYHAHHPELEVAYAWDEQAKVATVSVKQVQKLSDGVLLFRFPLPIRFKSGAAVENRTVLVTQKEEDFRFPLSAAPQIVRVDPGLTVLAKIKFAPPAPMAQAQWDDATDMIGRLLALEQLSSRRDQDTLARLKKTLNEDSFFGLRQAAAQTLRAWHSDEALDVLLASMKQSDARVRRQVVEGVAGFYRERAYQALREVLATEKNPDIRVVALRGLAPYARPEVRESLLQALRQDSFRNEIADAALDAMRAQDEPVYAAAILDVLQNRAAAFPTWGHVSALNTLAFLSRNETNREPVRVFLIGRLEHKNKQIKLGAIRALGTLGDPQAKAALNTFLTADKDSPERGAAQGAINELNAPRQRAEASQDLRNEVLELRTATEELKRELEGLRSQVAAAKDHAKPAAKPAGKAPGKPKPTR